METACPQAVRPFDGPRAGHLQGSDAKTQGQVESARFMITLLSGMKISGGQGLWLLFLVFLMSSCASNTEVVTESSTPSAATVPGEKVPGEAALVPGAPGTAAAGVRW